MNIVMNGASYSRELSPVRASQNAAGHRFVPYRFPVRYLCLERSIASAKVPRTPPSEKILTGWPGSSSKVRLPFGPPLVTDHLQAIITVLSLVNPFMGLVVIAMGVQFALTGMRSFMRETTPTLTYSDREPADLESTCLGYHTTDQ